MASSQRTSPPVDNIRSIDDARRKREHDDPPSATQPTAARAKGSTGKKGPSFNHEKVAAIKEAIANGTYSINPQRIADKFIEQESS
ncbi:MAG: flagellar biosynthesis anti-sigma factor FlgM [Gammaproteobacteria bacterium]|nr:flagellar biosynthesis anti-sigma factor FlgM [Gammaproteobacteria bacterium]